MENIKVSSSFDSLKTIPKGRFKPREEWGKPSNPKIVKPKSPTKTEPSQEKNFSIVYQGIPLVGVLLYLSNSSSSGYGHHFSLLNVFGGLLCYYLILAFPKLMIFRREKYSLTSKGQYLYLLDKTTGETWYSHSGVQSKDFPGPEKKPFWWRIKGQ